MAERRKVKRRYLLYYGRVYDGDIKKQLGYLVDITERGFMLLSDESFPIGATREFQIEVTSDISERPYIKVSARSVWCEPDIDPSRYNTGFEITALKPEDVEVINKIVQVYGFRDN